MSSNVAQITQKFDRDVDTVLTWFHADPTQPIPVQPWSALLQGPASDPEISPPPVRRYSPLWVRAVALVAFGSTTYMVGLVQGVLTTRGLQ